jgi:hypothetical protein
MSRDASSDGRLSASYRRRAVSSSIGDDNKHTNHEAVANPQFHSDFRNLRLQDRLRDGADLEATVA